MHLRIKYSKLGKVRFTGHRDVARLWERALRKAEIPVSYSEGFSPRPRVSFGLALPTGAESIAEYLDLLAPRDLDPGEVLASVQAALPAGFGVLGVMEIDKASPSLQEDVVACTWEFGLREVSEPQLREAVEATLAATELPLERSRKGTTRVDDVRPTIDTLTVVSSEDGPVLHARLATRPRGMRPGELLEVMFPAVPDTGELAGRVLRTTQLIERDGAQRDLFPPDAAVAGHTEAVCA